MFYSNISEFIAARNVTYNYDGEPPLAVSEELIPPSEANWYMSQSDYPLLCHEKLGGALVWVIRRMGGQAVAVLDDTTSLANAIVTARDLLTMEDA